jgi:hypothetical protein
VRNGAVVVDHLHPRAEPGHGGIGVVGQLDGAGERPHPVRRLQEGAEGGDGAGPPRAGGEQQEEQQAGAGEARD